MIVSQVTGVAYERFVVGAAFAAGVAGVQTF